MFTPTFTGTEDFCTDGDRLIRVVERYWKSPDSPDRFKLDDWQAWVIRHSLERFPCGECESCRRQEIDAHPTKAGILRYRQICISMGRQNGKSVLGGIFGFYGLAMHEYGPEVVGLASNREQADIIYKRVMHVITESPTLSKKFKTSGTRGLKRRQGDGSYVTKPAKSDAVQGFPISMCLFDELHVSKSDLWQAAVNGQKTKKNGLIMGFTTAGDDNSLLLKDLYKIGQASIHTPERFGFFLWEAPMGSTIDDEGAIEAANPSVACGRIPLETVKSDAQVMPIVDRQRYILNQFVASLSNWLPMQYWVKAATGGIPADYKGKVIFTVDTTPSDAAGTITATAKIDGEYYTEMVKTFINPTPQQIFDTCILLRRKWPKAVFAMDAYRLKDVAQKLKERKIETYALSQNEIVNACSRAYQLIVTGKVHHADDEMMRFQMPRAVRKNVGEDWRISRKDSSVDIDAVMATVVGLYVAEKAKEVTVQLIA
jgi:phage terminase large subunit-like protein